MKVDTTKLRALAKSQQIDINWGEPEAFALVPQQALDGDRISAEAKQSEINKQQAEKQQTQFV